MNYVGQGGANITSPDYPEGEYFPSGSIIRINKDGSVNIIEDPVNPSDPQMPGNGGGGCAATTGALAASLLLGAAAAIRGRKR